MAEAPVVEKVAMQAKKIYASGAERSVVLHVKRSVLL